MRLCFLPLALLFLAFTDPSIAQTTTESSHPDPSPAPSLDTVPEDRRIITMFELYQPLKFNCSDNKVVEHYQWFANNTAIVPSKNHFELEENGAVLVIPRAHEDNWGNYTCSVEDLPMRAWSARARPIARVPANTNVVEGQKFSIACRLIGKPYSRVRWTYRADEGLNGTELDTTTTGTRFTAKDSPAGVPGGVLEVTDAVRADAGLYACEPLGGTAATSTLRVKDVYAALWPFLGICLEVFILCAIILVYEKRRTKPELDDSDADTHDQ